jgi:hypothetical protein
VKPQEQNRAEKKAKSLRYRIITGWFHKSGHCIKKHHGRGQKTGMRFQARRIVSVPRQRIYAVTAKAPL